MNYITKKINGDRHFAKTLILSLLLFAIALPPKLFLSLVKSEF